MSQNFQLCHSRNGKHFKAIQIIVAIWLLLSSLTVNGQVLISNNAGNPDASAMLEITSTMKGLLIPRMTSAERDAITTPATSLMIFNTTTNSYNYWNGSSWIVLAAGNIKLLSDTDNDTKVEVEKNMDEDKVRITIAGNEIALIDNKSFQLKSPGQSVMIGENAGMSDDGSNNFNTFIGYEAGKANITGSSNTFVGHAAGDITTGSDNTFIGKDAGNANTVGNENTFIGKGAGFSNIAVGFNTFVGSGSGHLNTNAGNNTFIGRNAGFNNTSGAGNTFVGSGAGDSNNANSNTFIGHESGSGNVAGGQNTFVGAQSGNLNGTASGNTFIGQAAGSSNLTGAGNTFVGQAAGLLNTASSNTFIGKSAGSLNTSGTANTFIGHTAGDVSTASNNTFVGKDAGGLNTTGQGNTFIGAFSGDANTDASSNTFVGHNTGSSSNATGNTFLGHSAGDLATTGSNNTFVGLNAGNTITTGANNSAFGNNSDFSQATLTNATAIGNFASCNASNKVRIGNPSVTVIEGQVAYSFPSDARFKFNVKENIPGIEFIKKLRPVTYQFDLTSFNHHIMPDGWQNEMNEEDLAKLNANEFELSKIIHSGFIAQEVEAAAKEMQYDFHGIVKPQNEKDNYGLRYSEFVVPLVKAVQEQQMLIEELRREIEELKGK